VPEKKEVEVKTHSKESKEYLIPKKRTRDEVSPADVKVEPKDAKKGAKVTGGVKTETKKEGKEKGKVLDEGKKEVPIKTES